MLAKLFPERYRRWEVLVPVSLVLVYVASPKILSQSAQLIFD